MIVIQSTKPLEWDGMNITVAERAAGTIEVSADLLVQHNDLIEHLFALAFDVLGLQTIEVRVRPLTERAPWPMLSARTS